MDRIIEIALAIIRTIWKILGKEMWHIWNSGEFQVFPVVSVN